MATIVFEAIEPLRLNAPVNLALAVDAYAGDPIAGFAGSLLIEPGVAGALEEAGGDVPPPMLVGNTRLGLRVSGAYFLTPDADLQDAFSGSVLLEFGIEQGGAAVGEVSFWICDTDLQLGFGYMHIPEVVTVEGEFDVDLHVEATVDPWLAVVQLALETEGDFYEDAGPPVGSEYYTELEEAFEITSPMQWEQIIGTASRLLGADHTAGSVRWLTSRTDSLTLRDRLTLLLEAAVVDAATLSAVAQGNVLVTAALVDAVQLAGLAQGSVAAMALVSDLAGLVDVLASIQEAEATDAAAVADAIESTVRAMESIVAAAVFSSQVQGLAVLTVLVPEAAAITDAAIGDALRLAVVDDEVEVAVGLSLDGIPYVGRAINTRTRAVTEYEAFDYNSLATFHGRLYGAGAAGLYRLEGATDAGTPIDAYLRTAMQRLADGRASRVPDVLLGFRANGALQLKVTITDPKDGQRKSHVYDLVHTPNGSHQAGRFKVGRGLKSIYGAFELSNVAGADFALDVLSIRPLALDRRLK